MDKDSSPEYLAVGNRSYYSSDTAPSLPSRTNSRDGNWSRVSSERPQDLLASPTAPFVHYDFRLAPSNETGTRPKQTECKYRENAWTRKKTKKTSQRNTQKGCAHSPESCSDECAEMYARHSQPTCRWECRKHMFTAILQFNTKDATLAKEIKGHLESVTVQGRRVQVALMRDIQPTVCDTRKLDQLVDEETTTLYLILRTDNHDNSEQTNEITRRIKDFVVVPFQVVQIFTGDGIVRNHSDSRLKEVDYRRDEGVENFLTEMQPILQHASTTVRTDGKGIAQRQRCEAKMNRPLSYQQVSDQDMAVLHRSNTLPQSFIEGSPHVKKRFGAKMQSSTTRQPVQQSQYDADKSSLSSDLSSGNRTVKRGRDFASSPANPVSLQADGPSMRSTEANLLSFHFGCLERSIGQVSNHVSANSDDKHCTNSRLKNNVVFDISTPNSSELESSSESKTRKSLNNHSDDNTQASNMNSESHSNPNNLPSLKKDKTVTSKNSKIILNIDMSEAKINDSEMPALNRNSDEADSDKLESYNKINVSSKEKNSHRHSCPDKQQLQVQRPVARVGPSRREVQTDDSQSESDETDLKTDSQSESETDLKTFHSTNAVLFPGRPRREQNKDTSDTSDSVTLNENADQENFETQPKENEHPVSNAETEKENPDVGIAEDPVGNTNREASLVLATNIPNQDADGSESSACSTKSLIIPATSEHLGTPPVLSHEDDAQPLQQQQQQQHGDQEQRRPSRRPIGILRSLGRRLARGARFLSCASPRTSRENS